jgi:hypothetical protein
MKYLMLVFVSVSMVLLGACDEQTRAAREFSLPEGNPETGKVVFIQMQCNACHHLDDIAQLPVSDGNNISIKLGGQVTRIRSYGDLVTSIINPSHKIAQSYEPQNTDAEGHSTMRNYNDMMTVTQLVDLVSFLEPQYSLKPHEPSRYRPYHF